MTDIIDENYTDYIEQDNAHPIEEVKSLNLPKPVS